MSTHADGAAIDNKLSIDNEFRAVMKFNFESILIELMAKRKIVEQFNAWIELTAENEANSKEIFHRNILRKVEHQFENTFDYMKRSSLVCVK